MAKVIGRRVSVIALAVSCSLFLASCTANHTKLTPSETAELAAGVSDDLSHEQTAWQLQRVQQELVKECMQAKGLRYYVSDDGPYPTPAVATADQISSPTPTGYGVFGEMSASARGVAAGSQATNKEDAYTNSLPQAERVAYTRAYFGPNGADEVLKLPGGGTENYSGHGCIGSANAKLYGSAREEAEVEAIPQILRSEITAKLSDDSTFTSAARSWAGCMAALGYTYKSPKGATDELRASYERSGLLPALHAREQQVAQADAHCDAKSGLRKAKKAATTKALAAVSGDLERQSLIALSAQDSALKRARQILAQPQNS